MSGKDSMAVELKVPEVGESVTEVVIGEWFLAEGDHVERDQPVVSIETDKVTVELPAPVSGVISNIKVQKGASANVGDVIGYMEERAGAKAAKASAPDREQPQAARGDAPERVSSPAPVEEAQISERQRTRRDTIPPQGFARVMPSARKALRERGLRVEDVQASSPGGRIFKEDVERHVRRAEGAPGHAADLDEEVVAMTPFRRRIAERLVESQQTAALLTTFNEVDMSEVMALRKQYQEGFVAKYGIKLGFMSFFVKATIEALKLVPQVNAEIRGTDIVYKNYYDIGVAVGGGKGLVVPVIRHADRLSFAEVEQAIADFAARAKNNTLKLDELQGGTFTISNGGVYGSLLSTPIINPPQSGILGLHAIQDRPVVRGGQIVVRPMMYVALTYDHRLVDGREAVTFLKRIKDCVEQPNRVLLEV